VCGSLLLLVVSLLQSVKEVYEEPDTTSSRPLESLNDNGRIIAQGWARRRDCNLHRWLVRIPSPSTKSELAAADERILLTHCGGASLDIMIEEPWTNFS